MGKNCKPTVVAVTWTLLWVRRHANEVDLSVQKEIACVRKELQWGEIHVDIIYPHPPLIFKGKWIKGTDEIELLACLFLQQSGCEGVKTHLCLRALPGIPKVRILGNNLTVKKRMVEISGHTP